MKQFLSSKFFKVLFALGVLAIFLGSVTPGKQLPSDLPWDKALHFIGYFGLAFLARMGSDKRPSWLLIVSCITFSLIIELIQLFIPNRGFEWTDVLANSLGVLTGTVVALLIRPLVVKGAVKRP
ncbi:VanZ family protein [Kangiella sediminilitoris]|uniref:VanZ family protein n=1 Tax=Kangiella sediminilitoris TaxID=1144748 RepID=A0A1B3BB58_9GAMM|nr:VanZ family protein [Kangiella sediminilitoris]AOE50028.1 VanZ family protein [Kangiella sediminilitoris]